DVLSDEDDNIDVNIFEELSDEYQPSSSPSEDSNDDIISPGPRKRKPTRNINKSSAVSNFKYTSKDDISRPSTSKEGSLPFFAEISTDISTNEIDIDTSEKNNINDSVMDTIEQVIRDNLTDNDDKMNIDDELMTSEDIIWEDMSGAHLKTFQFTEGNTAGIKLELYERYYDKDPWDFYKLLVNQEIITMMVEETNKYAEQCKAKEQAPKARIHEWYNTNEEEMEKFIDPFLWMGLVSFPTIESYWSKNILYHNKVKSLLSRNPHALVNQSTHLVGRLRSNQMHNPKEKVIQETLKKGETVAAESNTGVVIQKWKDKREVLTLSTKHTAEMKIVRNESEKLLGIIDYNKQKSYIDLSDQMKANSTSLRRGGEMV
ncbi:hypothetical protein NQ314_020182, partial [Rhamnusium bicolor]